MDKELLKKQIKKAQKGDKQAFEEIYRIFINSIFYHTENLLDDKNDVEDTVQDIVYKMYRGIGKLKHTEAFKAWMHRIITTTCVNKNIKGGHAHDTFELDQYSNILATDEVAEIPEESAINGDINAALADIIKSLPKSRRQAIVMYYFDDMSYKEIAQATGVTVSTVSTNIMMAKKTIKDRMIAEGLTEREQDDMAPLVTAFLTAEINRSYSQTYLDQFCAQCDTGIEADTTMFRRESGGFKKGNLIIIASIAAIIVLLIVYFRSGYERIYDEHPTEPYRPNAEIELLGGDCPDGHVNPTKAVLNLKDTEGEVIGWRITPETGEIENSAHAILQGTGNVVTSEFENLTQNSYNIIWTLENDEKNRAIIIRGILILDGIVEYGTYK